MKKYLIAAAAAVMAASASAASAATVVVKFEGSVVQAYDAGREFGSAGTNLVGDSVVTTYTFDNTAGESDPISGTITLNGVTQSIQAPVAYFHLFDPALDGPPTPSSVCSFCAAVEGSNPYPPAGGFSFSLPPTILMALFDPVLTAQSANYELFLEGSSPAPYQSNSSVLLNPTAGNAFNTEVFVQSTQAEIFGQLGGVPEPATWASMILGLGLTGLVLRRRPAVKLI